MKSEYRFIVYKFPSLYGTPRKFKTWLMAHLYKFIVELNPKMGCEIEDKKEGTYTNMFGGVTTKGMEEGSNSV